jgi:hypothetical protein
MMAHLAEMPQMASTNYVSSTVDYSVAAAKFAALQQGAAQVFGAVDPHPFKHMIQTELDRRDARQPTPKEIAPVATNQRRLVQIFIADPDENVPLDQCLLYSGEQKLTDLTDQELFFEVDVKKVLDEHNAKRVTLVNKTVKERTENLEPARVRDLKMTVVTIASF